MNGRRVDLRSAEPKVSDKMGSQNKSSSYDNRNEDRGNNRSSYNRNSKDNKDSNRNNYGFKNDKDRRGGKNEDQQQ